MKNVNNSYERGLDKLQVGQLFVLNFPSAVSNKSDDFDNIAKLPAVILEKKNVGLYNGDWLYKVGFWSRWNKGQPSGMLVIDDLPVWRYFSKGENEPVEGILPEQFIKQIQELDGHFIPKEYGIPNSQLFYVEDDKNNPENATRVYICKEG